MNNVFTGTIPTIDLNELVELSRETLALTNALNDGTMDADELERRSSEALARAMAINSGAAGANVAADNNGIMREVANKLNEYATELDEVLQLKEKNIPCVRVDLSSEVAIMRNRLQSMSADLMRVAADANH